VLSRSAESEANQYSELCDHDTSTSQTDGRTNGRLAMAIPRSA